MNLQNYTNAYLSVKECNDIEIRNIQLAALMTGMEKQYNIPIMRDDEYNKANPNIMKLYKDISNARIF